MQGALKMIRGDDTYSALCTIIKNYCTEISIRERICPYVSVARLVAAY